jgi:hypothetical protein
MSSIDFTETRTLKDQHNRMIVSKSLFLSFFNYGNVGMVIEKIYYVLCNNILMIYFTRCI